MRDIGQKLKETREKRNLSIQDVSVAIKINPKTLQAIEDGDVDQLPAKPFLRGFVQTYSKFLDLNVDDIMRTFMEEIGTTRPKITEATATSETHEATEDTHKKIDMFKKVGIVVAGLVAVLLVYFIQKVVGRYEKEQQVAQTQKEALENQTPNEPHTPAPVDAASEKDLASEEKTSTESTKTETSPSATPAATTPAPIVVKPAEIPKPTTPAPTPIATAPVKETPAPTPTTLSKPVPAPVATAPAVATPAPAKPLATPVPAPASTPAPLKPTPVATTPTPAPAIPKPAEVKPAEPVKTADASEAKKTPQVIIIEALDNVEVRFAKDNESEKTVRLKPEQVLTIRADYKVNLNVNDGGAVSIIRNGRDAGVPGNLGKSLKVNYP